MPGQNIISDVEIPIPNGSAAIAGKIYIGERPASEDSSGVALQEPGYRVSANETLRATSGMTRPFFVRFIRADYRWTFITQPDASGEYRFENAPPGKYFVRAVYYGDTLAPSGCPRSDGHLRGALFEVQLGTKDNHLDIRFPLVLPGAARGRDSYGALPGIEGEVEYLLR